jgi:hypothetical protein
VHCSPRWHPYKKRQLCTRRSFSRQLKRRYTCKLK